MNLTLDVLMSAWSWALVQFLWQGLLLGGCAALLLALTRQAKPQVRYLISVSALLLCFAIPLLSTLQTIWIENTHINSSTVALSANAMQQGVVIASLPLQANSPIQWLTTVWLLGCALLTLRMLLGLRWISQTQRNAQPNANPALQITLQRLMNRFGISRNISLLLSDEIESPMTTGWWKPIILMPTALLTQVSPEYIEALIAHELAHIKRFDYLINLLQSLIEIILFFHPVIWWLSKQIRTERENIADDLAANALNDPHRLAHALAALDQFQLTNPLLAQAAHGGNLMSRIQRLIKPKKQLVNWKISVTLIGIVLAGLTVYASATTSNAENSTLTTNSKLLPTDAVSEPDKASSIDAVDAVDEVDTEDSQGITINTSQKDNHETYAVVIAGKKGMLFSGNTDDLKTIEAVKKTHPGDFLWFKRDQKAYIIQDPATIAKVQAAWKKADQLSAEMDALGDQMDVHGKNMDALGKKMDAVSNADSPISSNMEKLSREMQALGTQQEAMGREMQAIAKKNTGELTDAQRQALDQQMRIQSQKMAKLDQQMSVLSEQMELQSEALEKSMQPLEALSKEMDVASKPMEALGKQMDVLGEQMEVLSEQANKQVLSLIDQSLKNGQAIPVSNN